MFSCIRCGACCMNLKAFHGVYDDLDDGSGCCIHFEKSMRKCLIYENRPQKCNVLDSYVFFKDIITLNEYFEMTSAGCCSLRRLFSNKCVTKKGD